MVIRIYKLRVLVQVDVHAMLVSEPGTEFDDGVGFCSQGGSSLSVVRFCMHAWLLTPVHAAYDYTWSVKPTISTLVQAVDTFFSHDTSFGIIKSGINHAKSDFGVQFHCFIEAGKETGYLAKDGVERYL